MREARQAGANDGAAAEVGSVARRRTPIDRGLQCTLRNSPIRNILDLAYKLPAALAELRWYLGNAGSGRRSAIYDTIPTLNFASKKFKVQFGLGKTEKIQNFAKF